MTGPDGNRPNLNKYSKAKEFCFGKLVFCGLIGCLSFMAIFCVVFVVLNTDPDDFADPAAESWRQFLRTGPANEILDMASTIDKEPSYSVLIIWLIALAGPGGVMLLYPIWKKYAPPIIPYDGWPWYHPLNIHTICMLLPLPITGFYIGAGFSFSAAIQRLWAIGLLVAPATLLVAMPFFWITHRNLRRLEKDLYAMDKPEGSG